MGFLNVFGDEIASHRPIARILDPSKEEFIGVGFDTVPIRVIDSEVLLLVRLVIFLVLQEPEWHDRHDCLAQNLSPVEEHFMRKVFDFQINKIEFEGQRVSTEVHGKMS